MRRHLWIALALAVLVLLVVAAPALGQGETGWDNGEGIAGELNDKIVTAFGLGLVVFFPLFIVTANGILRLLERRKERRKAAALRRRTGW
jgi:hypothetical protein